MGGSAERKVSTQCAGKNNCNGLLTGSGNTSPGEPEDSSTPGGLSQACQQHTACIRWFLRPFSFIRWRHLQSIPPPQMVCSVSVTKSYKISWIWRKEKICILCLFLFTLFIFTYRLISRKEILIYLSLLKPLRWHSRGCLLLKMLHLPPCSHCLY